MKTTAGLILIGMMVSAITMAQVTDAETALRTKKEEGKSGWKTGGVITAAVTQAYLENWAAGGENSLAVNGLISLFANYKLGNNTWDNTLDIGYGMLKQGTKDFRKTDDKIDFSSKYGRKATEKLYYSALFNFKTQMTEGYNYLTDTTKIKISNLLAPAYVLFAAGMDYKPNDNFTLFASPVTGRMTLVYDQDLADAAAFGVDTSKNIRAEFGGYIRMAYKKDIMENVSFQTKLDLFSNYLKDPQNVDVNWECLLSMKVNKYLSATISTILIYDDNIKILDKNGLNPKPKTQFKEVLAVGFSYKF